MNVVIASDIGNNSQFHLCHVLGFFITINNDIFVTISANLNT